MKIDIEQIIKDQIGELKFEGFDVEKVLRAAEIMASTNQYNASFTAQILAEILPIDFSVSSPPSELGLGLYGSALIEAIAEAGITQAELGRRTNIARSRISDYANGRRIPTDEIQQRMSVALERGVK